jgi:predicted MFS family arabinose efflux permease
MTGFLGGYISEHRNYQVVYLILIPIYLLIIAIVMNYKDENVVTKSSINLLQTLKELFTDKRLLLVCLFLFLYKFSPGFGTPLTFIMRDTFHWSKQWLGTLDTISAAVGLLGAWAYFHYSKRLNLRKWLIASVFLGAVTTLAYLYFTPVTAIVYNVIFSVMGMFISLLILDFMARNTKVGLESTSFALLCSVSNLAATCNGFAGSYLFPIIGLQWLIIISAITSFACLPIIPFLKGDKDVNS